MVFVRHRQINTPVYLLYGWVIGSDFSTGKYRHYNTQSLTFLRVKWLSSSKPLGFIDSNAKMFNSFIRDWAGPHNHFWALANIKIKLD